MPDPLHISRADLTESDGRFDRFKLIGWWDQEKLVAAKVLVIGAGALGNEIVKNLALLGVGNVLIVDFDTIENSNLSRSVLYRAADAGKYKAVVAAEAARQIYPDINVLGWTGDVVNDLGTGVYRWADVIVGGLDNREARLSINRNAWRFGKPWIDGAIEQIQGVARVFVPDADQKNPCYECTMSERDWQLIAHRRSCNMLTREEMETGKTPTTPTISSIIAGVQCQEAVKLLHGMETIAGQGFSFAGLSADSYLTGYQRNADCMAHDTLAEIVELPAGAEQMTAAALLAEACRRLGPGTIVELGRDIVSRMMCPDCGRAEDKFIPLGRVKAAQAVCPFCGAAHRTPTVFHRLAGGEDFLDRPARALGIPLFDVVTARAGGRTIGLSFGADAARVLGPLASAEPEGLEWV